MKTNNEQKLILIIPRWGVGGASKLQDAHAAVAMLTKTVGNRKTIFFMIEARKQTQVSM